MPNALVHWAFFFSYLVVIRGGGVTMAVVRYGLGAGLGAIAIGSAFFAYCALPERAAPEAESALSIDPGYFDDSQGNQPGDKQIITCNMPPLLRYEAAHKSPPATAPLETGLRLVNNSGASLKIEPVSKSCGCARVEGLPDELAVGREALARLEVDDTRRESTSLDAVFRLTAGDKQCFLKLRRQFQFIHAVEVSPVVVVLKRASKHSQGEFSVKFLTRSSELAEQAEFQLQNGPKKAELQVERSRSRTADGTFEVVWQVTAASRTPEGRIVKNPPISFVMVTAGKDESWSAPMQFRWSGLPDDVSESPEAGVHVDDERGAARPSLVLGSDDIAGGGNVDER